MKRFLYILAAISMLLLIYLLTRNDLSRRYPADEQTLARGQRLFDRHCASCHGIQEDGIGPPLGGATRILSKAALIDWIRDPARVIATGDPRARYLHDRYRSIMPPFDHLDDLQIGDLLAYIDRQTTLLGITPLLPDTTAPAGLSRRLAPSVKPSGLKIELTDYAQFPRVEEQPGEKGIATLRAHPAGDGSLFISDQMGIIYLVEDGRKRMFLQLRPQLEHFIFQPGIGTGLGSFDLHPDFLTNGLFYTTHAETYVGKPAINDGVFPDSIGVGLQWVLSEWKSDVTNRTVIPGSRREVLRLNTPTTGHGVQDISFAPVANRNDPDYGLLYLGVGDGGSINLKRPDLVHHKRSLLGSILRIDPRGANGRTPQYGIPADNPFAGDPDPLVHREIWAYGFRNPHRLCWDTTHGKRLLAADIGESNIEELNVIEKGGDYGWSVLEGNYGINIKVDPKVLFPARKSDLDRYRAPFGQYDHSDGKAISGGFVYQGSLQALRGKYLFGDIVTGRLFYMNIDRELRDSTIYELTVVRNGRATNMQELCGSKRVHLRIGYDPYAGQLFVMTKGDGMVRRATGAYGEAGAM